MGGKGDDEMPTFGFGGGWLTAAEKREVLTPRMRRDKKEDKAGTHGRKR